MAFTLPNPPRATAAAEEAAAFLRWRLLARLAWVDDAFAEWEERAADASRRRDPPVAPITLRDIQRRLLAQLTDLEA